MGKVDCETAPLSRCRDFVAIEVVGHIEEDDQ